MGATYTAREVARLLGCTPKQIRRWADEAGLGQNPDGSYDFQDLQVLRSLHRLHAGGLSARRLHRAVGALRQALPPETPLSAVRLSAESGGVMARADALVWNATSGQLAFDFESREAAVQTLVANADGPAPRTSDTTAMDADAWFEQALEREEDDPAQAYRDYVQALACDPGHVESMINIGRLCSSAGNLERAAAHFRQAIRLDPEHAVAHFNLGVTLHDLDDTEGAAAAYERTLACDANFADAHFNLATLLEQQGLAQAALQHMRAYWEVCKRGPTPFPCDG